MHFTIVFREASSEEEDKVVEDKEIDEQNTNAATDSNGDQESDEEEKEDSKEDDAAQEAGAAASDTVEAKVFDWVSAFKRKEELMKDSGEYFVIEPPVPRLEFIEQTGEVQI